MHVVRLRRRGFVTFGVLEIGFTEFSEKKEMDMGNQTSSVYG